MTRFFAKPYRWARLYAGILAAAFGLALLEAFVIPRAEVRVQRQAAAPAPAPTQRTAPDPAQADDTAQEQVPAVTEPVVTPTSYVDENISITIETLRVHDTTLYIAEVILSDASLLRTALADDTYGRNIKDTTSAMAADKGAILAVNGDYYGFRDSGYVLRGGVLYRDRGDGQALVIDYDGNFSILEEGAAEEADLRDAWHVLSFGPALVAEGEITVDAGSEVGRAGMSNPRTAIGQVGERHYIFLVSDGRTRESAGLSLLQLAEVLRDRGCITAYNLDGGGSSTMVFGGEVLNIPTNGRSQKEREVSDIVYIGYGPGPGAA